MNLIYGQSGNVANWAKQLIPHVDNFGLCEAIGVSRDGACVGAVVYHEYRGNDIQMSCAAISKRWLTKTVLRAIFLYPFGQLKVSRVTAFTPARNVKTRQFLESTGFKQEGIMRQGFKGDDCVIYGMLRDECKWIEQEARHG